MNKGLKKNKNPPINLDEIENIQTILNEEEIRLISNIFNEIEEFYQITDTIENALSDNRTNYQQLNTLFKTIKKVSYYKILQKKQDQTKKSLARTFFELPEIISKKIHLYIYRRTF